MKNRLALTLPEYERIFRVVHSVSRSLDDRPGASCLFYNTVAALLLEKSLGVQARPVMGAAFFRVHDPSATALFFASLMEDGTCEGTENGFHCWIETEQHILDFTAPVYREYLQKLGSPLQLPRKMFQKPKAEMARSHHELRSEGDYFVQPSRHLTKMFLESVLKSPAVGDLADACLQWFKRPPKKIPESLRLMNDLREITVVNLTKIKLVGAW